MNKIATIGHNNPPDPIEEALAPFGDALSEAELWLDGERVEDAGQMAAVDHLIACVKAAIKAAKSGEEAEAKPLHEAWKAAKARWKPAMDDLDRVKNGLIAAVDVFKRAEAERVAAAERKARAAAAAARQAAENAMRQADAANIEAQRAADGAMRAADEAQRQANAAASDKVRGLRTVTRHEVTDTKAALHWIARNDKPAIEVFVAEYARKHHRDATIDGVNVWTEKEAF
jgi:hypothetical protein